MSKSIFNVELTSDIGIHLERMQESMQENVYMIPTELSPRGVKAHYAKMAKEILHYWKEKKIVLLNPGAKLLPIRLKSLIEKEGITLEQIKTAIDNYGKSEWHVENQLWKQPVSFLTKELILHWQNPRVSTKIKGETKGRGNDEMHKAISRMMRNYPGV